MFKIRVLVALLPLLFLLTACPYSAEFPLDNAKEKINSKYIGKWVEEPNNMNSEANANPNFFVISSADDNKYKFEKNDYNTDEKTYKKENFAGHFTTVGKVAFLNLQKEGETNYYFYKIELSADAKSFSMFEVTDNITEKFDDAAKMRAFFDKHKELSFFYNNKETKKYNKK